MFAASYFTSLATLFLDFFIWPGASFMPEAVSDSDYCEDFYHYPEPSVFLKDMTMLLAPVDLSGKTLIESIALCDAFGKNFCGNTGFEYLDTLFLNFLGINCMVDKEEAMKVFEKATKFTPLSAIIAHIQLGDFHMACSGDSMATAEAKSKDYMKGCAHYYKAAELFEGHKTNAPEVAKLAAYIKSVCDLVLPISSTMHSSYKEINERLALLEAPPSYWARY